MSTDYTMTELVESLKKRGLIPISEKTFDSSDLIRFMSEELQNFITPQIMEVRENYFLEYFDQDLVADQSRYEIHPRAAGTKIKSLFWFDSNDKPRNKLEMVNIDDIVGINWDSVGNVPSFFYFIDNYIEILPKPGVGATGYLRQYYFQRRNRLVSTSEAGQITQIAGTNITINSTPTGFNDMVQYDFVKGTPEFQNLNINVTPTGVSGTTFTFDADDIPSSLAVGDWLCLAGESPVAQIPLDAYPLLAQQGVYVTLLALNDLAGSSKAKDKRDELLKQVIQLVGTRSEDNAKTIVSGSNIGNFLMSGVPGWYGWPK